jgi:uncharacterized protein (DUF1778 family)
MASSTIHLQLTAQAHSLIERAAIANHQSMLAFATHTLVRAAKQVLARETQRQLSENDAKKFLSILDSDKVTPALARAVKKYKARNR